MSEEYQKKRDRIIIVTALAARTTEAKKNSNSSSKNTRWQTSALVNKLLSCSRYNVLSASIYNTSGPMYVCSNVFSNLFNRVLRATPPHTSSVNTVLHIYHHHRNHHHLPTPSPYYFPGNTTTRSRINTVTVKAVCKVFDQLDRYAPSPINPPNARH